jgi:hypothetical protein
MLSDHTYSNRVMATTGQADGRVFQFAAVRLPCSEYTPVSARGANAEIHSGSAGITPTAHAYFFIVDCGSGLSGRGTGVVEAINPVAGYAGSRRPSPTAPCLLSAGASMPPCGISPPCNRSDIHHKISMLPGFI